MLDTIREAPVGQAIRWLSGSKLLRYPEEEDGFTLPKLVEVRYLSIESSPLTVTGSRNANP